MSVKSKSDEFDQLINKVSSYASDQEKIADVLTMGFVYVIEQLEQLNKNLKYLDCTIGEKS